MGVDVFVWEGQCLIQDGFKPRAWNLKTSTESKDYVPAAVPMAPVEEGLRFMTVEAPDNYTTPSWSAVGRRIRRRESRFSWGGK